MRDDSKMVRAMKLMRAACKEEKKKDCKECPFRDYYESLPGKIIGCILEEGYKRPCDYNDKDFYC